MFAKSLYSKMFLFLALSLSFGVANSAPPAGLGSLKDATMDFKGKCEQDRHPDHPESCAVNASLVSSRKAPLELQNDEAALRQQCSQLANDCLEQQSMDVKSCLELYEVEGDCDFTEAPQSMQYLVPVN